MGEDCMQCKLIGSGVMLSVGAYFFLLGAGFLGAPPGVHQMRFHTLVGAAFTSMGTYRLVTPLRPENDTRTAEGGSQHSP